MGQRNVVGTPLPGAALPYSPLKRPGAGLGGKIEGWVLSEAIIGIATHFYDRRTMPCTKHLGRCEGCSEWKRKSQWNGYFAVCLAGTKEHVVFQVTRSAVEACRTLDHDAFDLRGSYALVYRKGESDQGAVQLAFQAKDFGRGLPPCPDVLASLARMWQMDVASLRRAVGWKEGAA